MQKEELTKKKHHSMTPISSSGPIYMNMKMAKFRTVYVQMPVGTPLFYKATLPATGLACTLPRFQSFRLET